MDSHEISTASSARASALSIVSPYLSRTASTEPSREPTLVLRRQPSGGIVVPLLFPVHHRTRPASVRFNGSFAKRTFWIIDRPYMPLPQEQNNQRQCKSRSHPYRLLPLTQAIKASRTSPFRASLTRFQNER